LKAYLRYFPRDFYQSPINKCENSLNIKSSNQLKYLLKII
jgi:hypothetical protein